MRTVTIEKKQLLQHLVANRTTHREIFLEAQANYRTQVIRELERNLEEAKAGKRIRRAVELMEPMDQTRDYDRAIKMLEMSVDATVILTEGEFAQLVLDDWGWKSQFMSINSAYTNKAMAAEEG